MTAVPGWQEADHALGRTFTFRDFRSAIEFMVEAAKVADQLDHHPEWKNVYNRVEVRLTTHDQGGVTDLDRRLATAMTELYDQSYRPPEA